MIKFPGIQRNVTMIAYVKIRCYLIQLVAPSVIVAPPNGVPENFTHREALANDVMFLSILIVYFTASVFFVT